MSFCLQLSFHNNWVEKISPSTSIYLFAFQMHNQYGTPKSLRKTIVFSSGQTCMVVEGDPLVLTAPVEMMLKVETSQERLLWNYEVKKTSLGCLVTTPRVENEFCRNFSRMQLRSSEFTRVTLCRKVTLERDGHARHSTVRILQPEAEPRPLRSPCWRPCVLRSLFVDKRGPGNEGSADDEESVRATATRRGGDTAVAGATARLDPKVVIKWPLEQHSLCQIIRCSDDLRENDLLKIHAILHDQSSHQMRERERKDAPCPSHFQATPNENQKGSLSG